MNKLLFPLALLLSMPLFGQQEEVVFDRVKVHGGFGGPFIEMTSMDDQSGVMVGGGGGVILNDFFLGGFGQGGSFAEYVADGGLLYPINFGFGGLWLGYTVPSHKAFHFFSSLKIAGGSISLTEDRDDNANTLFDETVFVAQPEVGAEVNLFKWLRIALTGNYRIVSGIQPKNLAGLNNRDFNAGGMALTFRFGKFYREGSN
jgi:hypothetical protein